MSEIGVEIEARFRDLEEQIEAQQLVISWLLSRVPGDDAVKFLSRQAIELDGDPKFATLVAVLDQLREDSEKWRALRASAPDIPC